MAGRGCPPSGDGARRQARRLGGRVVLDEALPRKLARILTDAGCPTEPFPLGWKGLKDGSLLDELEAAGWTVLLTCDRNMAYQQALCRRSLALVVVPGQRLQVLAPIVDAISRAITAAMPGTVSVVEPPPSGP